MNDNKRQTMGNSTSDFTVREVLNRVFDETNESLALEVTVDTSG